MCSRSALLPPLQVGIMHSDEKNRTNWRDPHVTYPLPTNAPRSLSTIYFCNKIISDVILHHRRKVASYALYSIPPASTTAASSLLSPLARLKMTTAVHERGGSGVVADAARDNAEALAHERLKAGKALRDQL